MQNDQHSKQGRLAVIEAHRYFRSQQALSMASGVHSSRLSDIINGRRQPSATEAALISAATDGKVKRHQIRPDLYRPDGSLIVPAPPPVSHIDLFATPRRGGKTSAMAEAAEKLGLSAVVADLERKHPPRRQRAAAKGKPKPARKKVT